MIGVEIMKKMVGILSILLLAGCSAGGNDSESSSSMLVDSISPSSIQESVVSSETMSSEETSSTVAVSSESLSMETSSSEAESRGEGVGGLGKDESSEITLYVPDTLKQDEGTELYTDVMGVAEQFTTESAPLSEEGLFTLSYTGYYIENEEGKIQAYFIGVNRVGEPLHNLSFVLNFLVDDTPVWDNVSFTLDESEFGEQPNNSAMPIFLDIPEGKEDLLMNAQPEQTFIEIKDLTLE